MSRICIKNGTIISSSALLKNSALLLDGGKIAAVGQKVHCSQDAITVDAKGCFVSPGFIDTHIHGSPGKIFENEIRSGTTSIVIAESCASLGEIFSKIRRIEKFIIKSPFGRNVLGVRLEGPYISRKKAGAQDRRYIKKPDAKEALRIIEECGPALKIMTIAPEIKGAVSIIKALKRNKIIASIGHSDATYDEAIEGIAAGIDHATHIFNAMRGVDDKDPGAGTAVLLADSVKAEVILDLIHVRKALFELLVAIKGADGIILITDSVWAEDRPGVTIKDDIYKLDNGTTAGSALTTIRALKNSVKECAVPLVDAVKMLTINPARLLGAERRKGKIAVGMDADLVIFDKNFDVQATIVNGSVVYRKKGF